jgi:hypothetical protein
VPAHRYSNSSPNSRGAAQAISFSLRTTCLRSRARRRNCEAGARLHIATGIRQSHGRDKLARDCTVLNHAICLVRARGLYKVRVKLESQLRSRKNLHRRRAADCSACRRTGRGPRRDNSVGPARSGRRVDPRTSDRTPTGGKDGPSQRTPCRGTGRIQSCKRGSRSRSDRNRRRIHRQTGRDRARVRKAAAATTREAERDDEQRESNAFMAVQGHTVRMLGCLRGRGIAGRMKNRVQLTTRLKRPSSAVTSNRTQMVNVSDAERASCRLGRMNLDQGTRTKLSPPTPRKPRGIGHPKIPAQTLRHPPGP